MQCRWVWRRGLEWRLQHRYADREEDSSSGEPTVNMRFVLTVCCPEEIIEWYLNESEDHTLSFPRSLCCLDLICWLGTESARFLSVVKHLRSLGMDEKLEVAAFQVVRQCSCRLFWSELAWLNKITAPTGRVTVQSVRPRSVRKADDKGQLFDRPICHIAIHPLLWRMFVKSLWTLRSSPELCWSRREETWRSEKCEEEWNPRRASE